MTIRSDLWLGRAKVWKDNFSLLEVRKACTARKVISSGQLTWIWFKIEVVLAETSSRPGDLNSSLASVRQGYVAEV